jgi:hypothetical protein
MKMTPLSWCIVVSAVANVATAAMVAWFMLSRPYVHVSGDVTVNGSVQVDGGTINVKPDKNAIQKVQICEETSELSTLPVPGQDSKGSQMVRAVHCAGLEKGPAMYDDYGLRTAPPRNR